MEGRSAKRPGTKLGGGLMLGDMSTVSGLRGRSSDVGLPAAVTDIGCEREINEDRYAEILSPRGRAWVVCDGMGGALGGELAAQLAIDAVRRKLESSPSGELPEVLASSIEEANRVIVLRRQNPAFSAMGTTVVAALIQNSEVALSHAGDSRAYLVRGTKIQQLTIDHTYVQDLVDRGVIKEDEALSHPQAHVLTKCLGAEPRLDLEIQRFWIWDMVDGEVEDKLVLVSDGLYSLVSDVEISEAVSNSSPQEACLKLVEMAKQRGGFDNITITILPLGGQLREERPASPEVVSTASSARTRSKAKSKDYHEPLSFGKQAAVMTLLFCLCSLITVMVVLAKLYL